MTVHSNHITFGTDGFRGIISMDFNFDTVRKIAQGLSDFTAYKNIRSIEKKHVAVGYDRRFMSDRFARVFSEVLSANGINVVLSSEPVPTPALSYFSRHKFNAGIMITASHNEHFYNGVKVKQDGRSAPPSVTAELESYITRAVPMAGSSANVTVKSFRKDYLSYLNSRVKIDAVLAKLKGKIVVDFMHGCGAEFAEEIFKSKNVIKLRCKRDPLFGGVSPEPIEKNLSELMQTVRKEKALFGIAMDGDADRFAVIDDKGRYLTPCQTAPLLFEYLLERSKLKGKLVQAVSMGYLTKRIARLRNLAVEEVPVGFKYIAEKMISEDISFGVEESGGYSWKGNIPERDGLLSTLLVMEIAAAVKKPLSEVYGNIENKYGKSVFIRNDFKLEKPVTNKHSFAVKLKKKLPKLILGKKIQEINTIDGLKVIMEDDSWFLMRPSGTEPLMRVYAETESQAKTRHLIDFSAKLVSPGRDTK
ncbi:MAG: phosphoglucomutase/phosphomannomutase family protein [Elusimicrobia bacterium]|nr:phosphoglucomutase/phosphomannomutase family protein [Elusimicrobiota bacterium]